MPIDFSEYARPPRLDAAGGVLLAIRLIRSMPADATPLERDVLNRVRDAAIEVQRIAKLRDRLRPQNLRATDRRFDGAWAALHGQLSAMTRLLDTEEGREAEALMTTLFTDGLAFVQGTYEEQWYESKRRLDRIDEEALEPRIAALVHASLLPRVREAHAALGDGLGVGAEPVAIPSGDELAEALRRLAREVAAYARALAAFVDEEDEAAVTRFRAALAAIEIHRDNTRQTGGSDPEPTEDPIDPPPIEDDLTPDQPVPPLA